MRHHRGGYWSRLQPVISGSDPGMDDTVTEGAFQGHSAQEVREAQARAVVASSKSVGDVFFGFVLYDPRVGKDPLEYTADNQEDIEGWYNIAKGIGDAETIGYYRDGELIEVTKNPKWLGEIVEPMTRDDVPVPPTVVVKPKGRSGGGIKLALAAAFAGIAGLVLGGHGKRKARL